MSPQTNDVLLRIRPSLPDPDDAVSAARGPLMMETVLSAMHSLRATETVCLEVGVCEGKIALFVRSSRRASALVESQLYAQFPDAEIEEVPADSLDPREGEEATSVDLALSAPEVFPIKRYPQFIDLVTRQNVDTIAGMTSALVRYPVPKMRGHIQVSIRPLGPHYRRRALAFIPLLLQGLPKHFPSYANAFARVHLSRGLTRLAFLPLDIVMGGFRTWFAKRSGVNLLTGEEEMSSEPDEERRVSMRSHEREDPGSAAADKVNRLLFLANVRVSVVAPASARSLAEVKAEEIVSSFRQFMLPNTNGFRALRPRVSQDLPHGFLGRPYVLSAEEVATLWHVPNILVKTPNFDWVLCRKLEPPVDLPLAANPSPPAPLPRGEGGAPRKAEEASWDDITLLGEAIFRGQRQKFGIRLDDRRRHMYVIGKTGMGKSTLLENMIHADILAGKGIAVIDPHGDLIDAALRSVPASRTNDVILFDPADRDFPVSFNMLNCPNAEQRSLVASGMMSVFKKLWPDVWSGRMEYILRNALLALIEVQSNSMLGILRIFTDNAYRKKILEHVSDHLVKSFWEDEFETWSEKYRTEAIAAVQNKIGQLLSVPLIRNIVGQVQSKVDIRHAMDSGKIILMNLSKGKLGEDNSAFLGSMMVTKFQLDAMSRADVPEAQRRDFFLYVDEFQNFATESFATILSEARKYRLNLTMANQYVNQLLIGDKSTALKDAVFGNVGSLCCFQVGSDDAEPLSEQFEEMVTPKDILSLPKYNAYMRLMIKGIPSKPFSVHTLPPPVTDGDTKRIGIIRRLSRERYAESAKVVEQKIGAWLASSKTYKEQEQLAAKAKEKEEEELKKARKKGMSLEQYRKWRDRELWTNEFNALRKKQFLDEALSAEETTKYADLESKLKASGGVPPPSKALTTAKKAV